MRKHPIVLILTIFLVCVIAGLWSCSASKSPVPRTDSYGGEEPEYSLTDDEAELYEILDRWVASGGGAPNELAAPASGKRG